MPAALDTNKASFLSLAGARVLVTGGTGFIGGHLVRRLVGAGCTLHVTGRAPGRLAGLPVAFHAVSLEDAAGFAALARQVRPDITFHLAARIERDRRASLLTAALRDNALPVAALCEALTEIPGARLVVLCSGEDYGIAKGPWYEGQEERPVSPYGLSKVVAGEIVKMANAAFGLQASAARAPVVYGPGQRPGQFVPSLISACLGGQAFPMTPGDQLRDFLYVDDLVEGLIQLTRAEAMGRIVHLASGQSVRIVDVARRVRDLVGRGDLQIGALPHRPTEIMEQLMSPRLAHELLGWRAQISLEEGLARTIAAARSELAP